MSETEQNGRAASDDEKVSVTIPNEDADSSNNSASEAKSPASATKQKPGRSSRRERQSVRQAECLKRQAEREPTTDPKTQALLDLALKPKADGKDAKAKVFKNQLMLSENLDEIPTGFAKNWLMIVAPAGSRCLVVSHKGHTGAYAKSGFHIISHPSCLLMGNKMFREGSCGPCILDCIYSNEMEIYFVIDVMCWDGRPLYHSDTQTRQRLLHEKIREHTLSRPSPLNPYPFVALKGFTPTKSNICGAIREVPYHIDGLIFMHKLLMYKSGATPLCLWLTLDRLPLKMKIEIPDMGIFACHNYSDPVALAMAHGVSPAIISQVFPAARSRSFAQHYPHPKKGQYHDHPPMQQKGWHGWNYSPEGMSHLSEMMHNMNLHYGANNHNQMNYNNSSSMYRGDSSHGYHSDHWPQYNQGQGWRGKGFQNMAPKKQMKKPNKKRSGHNKQPEEPKYQNWDSPHGVMKSQWIGSCKPNNFEEDYLMCPCPMAKRRIIVATGGTTCTYNKYGKLVDAFTSTLPNGAPTVASSEDKNDLTILDSLWCGSIQKFYVIDVMHWRQQPFYDTEAESRFTWLTQNFTNVTLNSGQKEYQVELLAKHSCSKSSITSALSQVDYKVDGLLCIQKKSQYSKTPGVNAIWLKLDMMEELLGYAPPSDITFKPSTDKERKQREYFISIGLKKEEGVNVKLEDEEAEECSAEKKEGDEKKDDKEKEDGEKDKGEHGKEN